MQYCSTLALGDFETGAVGAAGAAEGDFTSGGGGAEGEETGPGAAVGDRYQLKDH